MSASGGTPSGLWTGSRKTWTVSGGLDERCWLWSDGRMFYVFAINKVSRFERLVAIYNTRTSADADAKMYNSAPSSRYFKYIAKESLNG